MTKRTLLLVFIHGFKGSDNTFAEFPQDLRALLSHTLPHLQIVSVQYPRYETRGDLRDTVSRFREWLQNKVIDIEVENRTPSPTVDPSVHVVLCGHSMGGIVAAETLLAIAKDEPIHPPSHAASSNTSYADGASNSTTPTHPRSQRSTPPPPSSDDLPSSSTPPVDPTRLFFPYIQAIVAFDTPYLGISPGVLAHGAEEQLSHASSAYKAFETSSSLFGWKSPRSATPSPIPDAANRGLPAPQANSSAGSAGGGAWSKWGKYAAFAGGAAALAGAAGAAYMNRNQISQGFAWAGSHLEFVGTLAKGEELKKRVQHVVKLQKSHGVGFADFYTALGEKAGDKDGKGGSNSDARTFCVVPRSAREPDSPTGTKRDAPHHPNTHHNEHRPPKSQKASSGPTADLSSEMNHADQVQHFADDPTRNKGHWVKCVNEAAPDELKAHTGMFSPRTNSGYHAMRDGARDEIVKWVKAAGWSESAVSRSDETTSHGHVHEHEHDRSYSRAHCPGHDHASDGVESNVWT